MDDVGVLQLFDEGSEEEEEEDDLVHLYLAAPRRLAVPEYPVQDPQQLLDGASPHLLLVCEFFCYSALKYTFCQVFKICNQE